MIVPVPLHPSRLRERGYNQAALLARELSAYVAGDVVEDCLIRTKATIPQVGLRAQERRANVRDAFRCVSDSLSGKRVLLVDDVFTTGATLESAGAALRGAGVFSVWAYTLARAR
jgi:ComF family protein